MLRACTPFFIFLTSTIFRHWVVIVGGRLLGSVSLLFLCSMSLPFLGSTSLLFLGSTSLPFLGCSSFHSLTSFLGCLSFGFMSFLGFSVLGFMSFLSTGLSNNFMVARND
jgi:hypothetical protein